MKIYDKKLAYPYFVWMTLFTVVPLIIVVYYAFTDANGAFTLDNLTSISGYGSVFARSLLLAELARRAPGKEVYLYTDDACTYQFYEKRGFHREGERCITVEFGGRKTPLRCFLYSRVLG